jgi:hypothetical protein
MPEHKVYFDISDDVEYKIILIFAYRIENSTESAVAAVRHSSPCAGKAYLLSDYTCPVASMYMKAIKNTNPKSFLRRPREQEGNMCETRTRGVGRKRSGRRRIRGEEMNMRRKIMVTVVAMLMMILSGEPFHKYFCSPWRVF